jgi:hypothetical protein
MFPLVISTANAPKSVMSSSVADVCMAADVRMADVGTADVRMEDGCDSSCCAARALLVQVPAKQLPDGHVLPSALFVGFTHSPVVALHLPGLRQLPA